MNSKVFSYLNKPEYFFRPQQIVWRLLHLQKPSMDTYAETILPWGLKIKYRPGEMMNSNIWRAGLYDLCVSEAIWRLLEPGELALDIGANIGHMTSIMAVRVGATGTVMAFEPHPTLFQELSGNLKNWSKQTQINGAIGYQLALSDAKGTATLGMPNEFDQNHGIAALVDKQDTHQASKFHTVETVCLDDVVEAGTSAGLMKIDVEGHELSVLKGGIKLIEQKRIRDVIFEENEIYPTPVTDFLEHYGYTLFHMHKAFLGMKVTPIAKSCVDTRYEPNYLATLNPVRALSRLAPLGWQVLRGRKP